MWYLKPVVTPAAFLSFMCGCLAKKERRQSRDMETSTEQEYLEGAESAAVTSSDRKDGDKTSAADVHDDQFFGMQYSFV